MVKEIPLTQGKVAMVDDQDCEHLSGFRWHAMKTKLKHYQDKWYAIRTVNGKPDPITGKRKGRKIYMHQVILGTSELPDHIDGDSLNNQRSNIRPATNSQNQANRKARLRTASSQYRGVTWNRKNSKWQSAIKVNQKSSHLGMFDDPIDAAKAYDKAAQEHFGEYAWLNFPLEGEQAA